MDAVVFRPDGPTIENRPIPRPGAGDVLIEVAYCGICGSDLHAAEPIFTPGTVMGHEFVGTVVSVSPDVTNLGKGARVAVNPNAGYCGECPACARGAVNLCAHVWDHSIGVARDGALASHVVVPARFCHALPEELDFRQAAIAEPLAVALRATKSVGSLLGESCVIFGGGPIGLLVAALTRAAGAREVTVVEPHPARRHLSRKQGATRTIDPREVDIRAYFAEHGAPRFIFECSGVAELVGDAVDIIEPGGTVTLTGLAMRRPAFDSPNAIFKEVMIRGSFVYVTEFEEALDLLAARLVDVEPLISGVVRVAEAEKAFTAMSTDPEAIKYLISDTHF